MERVRGASSWWPDRCTIRHAARSSGRRSLQRRTGTLSLWLHGAVPAAGLAPLLLVPTFHESKSEIGFPSPKGMRLRASTGHWGGARAWTAIGYLSCRAHCRTRPRLERFDSRARAVPISGFASPSLLQDLRDFDSARTRRRVRRCGEIRSSPCALPALSTAQS